MTLIVVQVDRLTGDELELIWKEAQVVQPIRHLPEGAEKYHEKTSVRIAGAPAKIRTGPSEM